MNRLTKKDYKREVDLSGCYSEKTAQRLTALIEITHKLGKLEDIEEELGCPLEVVFKALIEGIHIQTDFLDIPIKDFILKPRLYFSYDFKCYCLETGYGANMIKLKDYGKTWWLKGEKENE